MKEWRVQHPRATLSEMEVALDESLNRMRARMLEDMALASRGWFNVVEPSILIKQGI